MLKKKRTKLKSKVKHVLHLLGALHKEVIGIQSESDETIKVAMDTTQDISGCTSPKSVVLIKPRNAMVTWHDTRPLH